MTNREFARARRLAGLSGPEFADLLGIGSETSTAQTKRNMVSRIEKGDRTAPKQAELILRNEGLASLAYPDAYVIGASPEEDGPNEYVMRTIAPRFIARVGADDPGRGGLSFAKGCGEVLFDIMWLDTPPPRDQWPDYFKAAGEAVDRYTDSGS